MKRSGLSMAAMVATVVMVLTVSTYASWDHPAASHRQGISD